MAVAKQIWLAAWTAVVLCVASSSATLASAQTHTAIPLATRIDLHSEILDEDRTIEVALPEGYEQGDDRYPVLYLLDGLQNLRHGAGSAEVLARTGQIPPVIIVGIESGNRMHDFTPSSVGDVPYSGGAGQFLRFIDSELIPYVEAHYRTHRYRVLEGHSLGGVFTAYSLMERPELFDAYIVMSPAFWWNNEEMTGKAKAFFARHRPLRAPLFFGIGAEDGDGMKRELDRFIDVLRQRSQDGLRWAHYVFEDEGHMSAPLLTTYHGLKFVFADMRLPKQLWSAYDDSQFRAHEARIVEKYGRAARQSGETYVTLGLKLMKDKDHQGAITVLERNADAYPAYPPNYAWLAEAYEANGQRAKALQSYRDALGRSHAMHYGQEEEYTAQIARLEGLLRNDR
ncbi:MAG TPA: alpha/beta hydrolase-fold protein [Vicinamibacterales bacterium]|nr:alpha/beta hydrolase-fold protein [Vicinamibacterales bacterium]